MPSARVDGYGMASVASASAVLRLRVPVADGATFRTVPLDVADLPRIFFYIYSTSATLTVTPQFSVMDEGIVAGAAPEWLDFSLPGAVLPGVPLILRFEFPAKFVRLSFTDSGGGGAQSAEVVMAGTQ